MQQVNNPFVQMLEDLNSRALFELSARMAECVERSQETGKMSTLTVTLKFKPQGQGRMEITDEIKHSLPEYPRATTLMFATVDGLLQKDDPKQVSMNLKVVDTGIKTFKEVK